MPYLSQFFTFPALIQVTIAALGLLTLYIASSFSIAARHYPDRKPMVMLIIAHTIAWATFGYEVAVTFIRGFYLICPPFLFDLPLVPPFEGLPTPLVGLTVAELSHATYLIPKAYVYGHLTLAGLGLLLAISAGWQVCRLERRALNTDRKEHRVDATAAHIEAITKDDRGVVIDMATRETVSSITLLERVFRLEEDAWQTTRPLRRVLRGLNVSIVGLPLWFVAAVLLDLLMTFGYNPAVGMALFATVGVMAYCNQSVRGIRSSTLMPCSA